MLIVPLDRALHVGMEDVDSSACRRVSCAYTTCELNPCEEGGRHTDAEGAALHVLLGCSPQGATSRHRCCRAALASWLPLKALSAAAGLLTFGAEAAELQRRTPRCLHASNVRSKLACCPGNLSGS
jgi:hypothetical protein